MYTAKTTRAISKYGIERCIRALSEHEKWGHGASTIGHSMGLTTQQTDAAINAGREIKGGA